MNDPTWVGPHKFAGSIFVGKDYLGDFEFPAPRGGGNDEVAYYFLSYAAFCPSCGEVWARIVVTDFKGRQCKFQVHTLPCEQHYTWSGCVPGALSNLGITDLLDHFPEPAIRREFRLHMQHFEKGLI